MNRSENISELAKALSQFQSELRVVAFDSNNPFFKSKYASLAAIITHAMPVLAKNELAISQLLTEDAGVETVLMHSSGQFISSIVKLKPVKEDPQGLGSAITYARRYALSAILGIAADQDDDANVATGTVETKISTFDEVIAKMKHKFPTIEAKNAWMAKHGIKTPVKEMKEGELSQFLDLLNELP